jgi:predicted DNA binding CopG/RHH family protein
MKKRTKITAKDLEERFDNEEDVLQFFDTTKAEVREPKTQRVNVDFPEWIVRRLDDEASRLGISRQSLIKFVVSAAFTESTPVWQPASAISAPFQTHFFDAVQTVASALHEAPDDKIVIDLVEYLRKALAARRTPNRRLRELALTVGRTAAR